MYKYLRRTFFIFLTFCSINADAGVIELSLDEAQGIVKASNGYEWLRWDLTKGFSTSKAIGEFAEGGWRVASSHELFGLLNGYFNFGEVDSVNKKQKYDIQPSQFQSFGYLFGFTQETNRSAESNVWFGTGRQGGRYMRRAFVRYIAPSQTYAEGAFIEIDAEGYYYTDAVFRNVMGVALIRKNASANPVNGPSTIFIFSVFLILICSRPLCGLWSKN